MHVMLHASSVQGQKCEFQHSVIFIQDDLEQADVKQDNAGS
jgi:hypothetical protein